ncbi:MAG: transposase [Faecalibacillus faecis]
MSKPVFDDEFKQGVVDYANQHPEEFKVSIAKRFGIADSTIHKWIKMQTTMAIKLNLEDGNFSSDEAKEIARLRKELKDTQDALEVLKRLLAYWENKQNRYL